MKCIPIICIELKEQLRKVVAAAMCNYAGCGLTNDGWPTSPFAN